MYVQILGQSSTAKYIFGATWIFSNTVLDKSREASLEDRFVTDSYRYTDRQTANDTDLKWK